MYQAFNFRKIKHLFMVSARFCDIYFTLQTCMSSSCILPLSYQNNIVYNMPYFFNNCFWKLNIIWKYCMTLSMMRWEMREREYEDCSHQNCFWYDAPRGSPGYRYTLAYRIVQCPFASTRSKIICTSIIILCIVQREYIVEKPLWF